MIKRLAAYILIGGVTILSVGLTVMTESPVFLLVWALCITLFYINVKLKW
jgi:hypothetical protein